jgi:N-acetylglucosaminyl-diphospho-decaprenol L-rhamnosyltransferase
MSIELSIIIVSYNSRAITLECLASLYALPPTVSYEVIILDNASSDGSATAISTAFPQAQLIEHPDNVGFAQGNNLAAQHARGRRILLLNPDTIVLANSFAGLWKFAERSPERGIWGGRTLFADMSLNPTSCWHRITLWSLLCSATGLVWLFPRSSLFNPEAYGNWQRDREREVDIVTGCFLLIDRTLWNRLGGFDPAFFMYAEEADLCLRARTLGARPAIAPEAEIIHLGGASETSRTDRLIKILRGRVTLIRKHWSPLAVAMALLVLRAWGLSRLIAIWVVSRFMSGQQDTLAKWKAVWQRRAEWLAGYGLPVA